MLKLFKLFTVIAALFIMKKLITFWAHIQKKNVIITNSTHLILIGLLLAFQFVSPS